MLIDKNKLHPAGVVERLHARMISDLQHFWDSESDGLDKNKVISVNCSLCSAVASAQDSDIFRKYRFPYVQCPNCRLIYPSIIPKPEYVHEQYVNGRFASVFNDLYLPSAEYRMKTIFTERVHDIIRPRVPKGTLLDVGCSSGHFLKVAEKAGYDVYGIEPNPDMVAFAKDKLLLKNITCGYLKTGEYAKEMFDVVTLWDVLEHVPDPHALVNSVFDILKPGGWVFAYTENVDSFNYFITRSDSEMFAPDVHLRHYSPLTFRREFEKGCFVVREVMTNGLDVQHILTTISLYPEKYDKKLPEMLQSCDWLQEIINVSNRGDNLRLYAQKKEN